MQERYTSGTKKPTRFQRIAGDIIDRLLLLTPKKEKIYNPWDKTESMIPPDQIDEILQNQGIERYQDRPHILKFVAEVPADFELEGTPSFDEFYQEHPELIDGKDEWPQTYLFTGDDEALNELQKIHDTYKWDYQKIPFLNKWRSRYHKPISFCYRADPNIDVSYDKKAFFWIDDKFAGSATVTITGPQYEGYTISTCEGFIEVDLCDQPVAQISWMDLRPTDLRWSVEPYIRHRILGEPQKNIITAH